ncbi:hypothetical protein GQ600_19211 [Phytophthora cactorum]|nr:hypothetical protein GQ600_19211 [Phytophthora cactorum]
MTKEKYAEKLGITKQLEGFTKKNIEGMLQFMQTHKYQKYQNYATFLEDKGSLRNMRNWWRRSGRNKQHPYRKKNAFEGFTD